MPGELHIEEHKNDLKQAAGEKQNTYIKPADAKSVDDFFKDLKIAGKEDKTNTKKEKTEKLPPTERAKMNEFIKSSPAIIDGITKNLSDNLEKIGKTEIDIFIQAKEAFDEDVKRFKTLYPEKAIDFKPLETSLVSMQKWIDLKQIEIVQGYVDRFNKTELEAFKSLTKEKNTNWTDNATYKIISDRIQILEKNETKNAEAELNKNRTPETAKKFFETNDENNFKNAFDEISRLTTTNIESYKNTTDQVATTKVKNFEKLIKAYTKDETINNISLIVAWAEDTTYPQWTRIIRYNQTIKENNKPDKTVSKDIIFWSQEQAQAKKAEKFDISKVDISITNPLAQFDGKGNYKSLEKYIKANPDKLTTNFKNIADAILTYQNKSTDKKTIAETPDMYEDTNALKNGYANVLTDYIITHTEILDTYCSYLTTDNMNILWADKATRIANFNKLATNQSFLNTVKTLKLEQQILDLRTSIAEEKKTSLKEWLKSLGNAMVSLLMMFWIGKGKLKSRLPKSMRKDIDDAYGKEFALEKEEKEAIIKITEDIDNKENPNRTTKPPKADEIEKANKIKNIDNIDKSYYKFIDPKIIRKWMEIYKTNTANPKINDSDIIISKNNKEEANLTRITQNNTNENIFKEIITGVINSADTRSTIANTNNKIWSKSEKIENKTKVEYSEYYDDKDERTKSIIRSPKDIGVYLLWYLFVGSKDLAYTITENNLIANPTISENPNGPEKPQTAKEYIVWSETTLRDDEWKEIANSKLPKDTPVSEEVGIQEKTAKDLKITEVPGWKTVESYMFKKVKATIETVVITWWIPSEIIKEKTASTPETTPGKPDIEKKYINTADGTLTWVQKARIDQIFTDFSEAPQKLKITKKWDKTAKNIEQWKAKIWWSEVLTYVYTDNKNQRVTINDWDKLEAANETAETSNDYTVYEIKDNAKIEFTKTKATTLPEGSFIVNWPQVNTAGEIVWGYVKSGEQTKARVDPATLPKTEQGYFADNNGIFGFWKTWGLQLKTYEQQKTDKTEYTWAFQNGPILVKEGIKTSKFNFGADGKYTRSGIGFTKEWKAMAIYSKKAITMDEFAQIFVDKWCSNAIYLDWWSRYSGVADNNGTTGALASSAMKLQFNT